MAMDEYQPQIKVAMEGNQQSGKGFQSL